MLKVILVDFKKYWVTEQLFAAFDLYWVYWLDLHWHSPVQLTPGPRTSRGRSWWRAPCCWAPAWSRGLSLHTCTTSWTTTTTGTSLLIKMMRKRKYIDLLFVTLFMNYYILLIRAPLFVESRPVLDSINLNISFNFVTLLRGVRHWHWELPRLESLFITGEIPARSRPVSVWSRHW